MKQANDNADNLSNLQLQLLKSLKYIKDKKQLLEIKSLLRYYFTQQLNAAIEEVEAEKNYSAEIYEGWLKANDSAT